MILRSIVAECRRERSARPENGGRYITIFPSLDVVVAVQPDEREGQPPVPLHARPDAYNDLLADLIHAL